MRFRDDVKSRCSGQMSLSARKRTAAAYPQHDQISGLLARELEHAGRDRRELNDDVHNRQMRVLNQGTQIVLVLLPDAEALAGRTDVGMDEVQEREAGIEFLRHAD